MKKICELIPDSEARKQVEATAEQRNKESHAQLKKAKQNMAKAGHHMELDIDGKGMRNPGKHKMKKNQKKKNQPKLDALTLD